MGGARRRWWQGVLPRRTVRLRLTFVYGTLFLASGVVLVGITYALVRHDIGDNFLVQSPTGQQAVFGGTNFSFHLSARVPNQRVVAASGSSGGSLTVQVPVPVASAGQVPSPSQVRAQLDILRSEAVSTQHKDLHELLVDSGLALLATALLSIAFGWLMAGRALRPLRAITAKAQEISSTNLHERLALGGPDDEVKELGDTFDALLGRLERAFEAQRQFVANASHELRTPLARLRALLEVASQDPRASVASLRAASEQAVVAGEDQEKIIEALLTMASSERGIDDRVPFDLAAAAAEAIESKDSEATVRGVRVDAQLDTAPTAGNERLARRLVANLLDNALRYNVDEGWVSLSTGTEDGRAVLRVVNSGPVVPPSELERLLRPFERLGSGRTAREGHGLGLSIVCAVAEAHDATVSAQARPQGGLEVEIGFPCAPGAVPTPSPEDPSSTGTPQPV